MRIFMSFEKSKLECFSVGTQWVKEQMLKARVQNLKGHPLFLLLAFFRITKELDTKSHTLRIRGGAEVSCC